MTEEEKRRAIELAKAGIHPEEAAIAAALEARVAELENALRWVMVELETNPREAQQLIPGIACLLPG